MMDSQSDQFSLASRRGANLSVMTEFQPRHAQTFDQTFSTKPDLATSGVHHSNTDPSLVVPQDQPISRRSSKMALKGIFGKNRGSREGRTEDMFEDPSVEEGEEDSFDMDQNRINLSSTPEPKDRTNRMSKLKGIKRTPKIGSSWEPPPLFQAYPQAVKEALLQAPAMDTEAVLRLDKMRKLSQLGQDSTADLDLQGLPEDEQGLAPKKKGRKRGASAVAALACIPKLYILTTDGHLLQYSFEGQAERMPERMMQLNKDSAAFASDAIPGKHWVLQVSQTFGEDGAVADLKRPSMFSKFGFNNDMKKSVSHFLLVMNSAEEMNTWLVTIRKEIQSLGGQAYRPDESVGKSPAPTTPGYGDGLIQPVQGTEPERDPSPGPIEHDQQRSSDASLFSPPGSGLPPPSVGKRQSWDQRISTSSTSSFARLPKPLPSPTSKFQVQTTLLAQSNAASSNSSPRQAAFNLNKALPDQPTDDTQARINALGIINADTLRLSAVAAIHSSTNKDDAPLSPRSFAGTPRSPLFPVSNYNPDAVKYSMDSPRLPTESPDSEDSSARPFQQTDAVSTRAQISHVRNSSGSTRRTSRSGFGQTPELTDGESLPQETIPGECMLLSTEQSQSRATSRSRASPQPCSGSAPQWGLAYQAGMMPNPEIHLLPPPHPPPSAALPPLPPGAVPHVRPTSAQDNRRSNRSVSPAMQRPKVLRRPSSMLVTSPTGTQWPANPFAAIDISPPVSTLKLPMAAPLTIKERRRLTHLAAGAVGPPASPAPSSPLPPPPASQFATQKASQPLVVQGDLSPSIDAQLYRERRISAKPDTVAITNYSEVAPAFESPNQLSAVGESWARYLERVGAA